MVGCTEAFATLAVKATAADIAITVMSFFMFDSFQLSDMRLMHQPDLLFINDPKQIGHSRRGAMEGYHHGVLRTVAQGSY